MSEKVGQHFSQCVLLSRESIIQCGHGPISDEVVLSPKIPFFKGVGIIGSVCNLSTKEHKSKSAAITQTGNRVQNLAGVRNETKSSESKFGKAQVSIC